MREVVLPAVEADRLDRHPCRSVALILVHPLDLEAVGDVVEDAAVRQQAVVLEDHCDLLTAEVGELPLAIFEDVLAVEADCATGRLDQPDQAAGKRGLAAP